MSFETVMQRLEERGLNPSTAWNGEVSFLCPAHDDGSPSAGMKEADDGKVLLHCLAGCDVEDVLTALDLTMGDLFPNPRVVAEYVYTNALGDPVLKVERWEPGLDGKRKSFKQYRRVGDRWVAGLADAERPLYHLPDVLRAEEVWLVEGEKDADRLNDLFRSSDLYRGSVIATTGMGGAGQWRPEWTAALEGKHVVMVPDEDKPGLERLERVRAELEENVASFTECHVLEGKDVSDHLDAGHTLDELTVGPRPRALRLKSIDFTNIPPQRVPLYEPFLYERALTWLWGPSGHGKSIVMDKVMADLSQRGVPSVLFEWEEGYQEGARLMRLGADTSRVHVFNMMDADEPVDLATPWFADEAVEIVNQTGARLVIFNPFILAGGVPGGDNPDSWNAAVINAREVFKRIIEETSAAVVVIDHADNPEGERAHGGRSKKWLSDLYIRVTRDGSEYTPGSVYHLKLENLKQSREWVPVVRATVHGKHQEGPLNVLLEYYRPDRQPAVDMDEAESAALELLKRELG